MTAPHIVDPAGLLGEALSKASPDLMRTLLQTVINAMAESFFATLKTEFYYRRVWPTKAKTKLEVGAWIEDRYNRRRRHSSIGQISPVTFEMQHWNQTAADQEAA